jgi:hypothetical protein
LARVGREGGGQGRKGEGGEQKWEGFASHVRLLREGRGAVPRADLALWNPRPGAFPAGAV